MVMILRPWCFANSIKCGVRAMLPSLRSTISDSTPVAHHHTDDLTFAEDELVTQCADVDMHAPGATIGYKAMHSRKHMLKQASAVLTMQTHSFSAPLSPLHNY